MVLNAAKLSGNKDTFAKMNNGGAFMYVSEDIFENVESPTIFEVDSSGHTTSLWESNAHGGLIAVNDVRPLSELGSKIQAKHIAHSAINAALRCANDSEDGEYFANLFLEQLYKRLSRSNKKSQKIILERTTISSGETISAELTIKDSAISLKTGNRKSITWSVGDSTNSSEIFAELNSIFKTEGAERYTYKTIVDKKENFYVIADALEQTFKEGRKHKKLKSVSKLKINASIATQNVHVQDVWNNIDRKNSFSYNATIYTIAAPILERSESSEETKEEVKPQPKKKTKVKPEIADVLKKVVAELNLFGTTPNQLTTDGTWYLYDAGGLLSVNQSTGKYNYNPNTILPEGVTVNDIADLFASEEILEEYLDNGGDDSIAVLIENLKKDDNTQNCSM